MVAFCTLLALPSPARADGGAPADSAATTAHVVTAARVVTAADRAAAHDAYEKGKVAFAARDYLRAASLFLDAYALAPHHDPLWNAARSLDLGGEAARAANAYSRYLDEAPADAKDRDRATAARKELATRLGRLDVQAPGMTDVTIDGAAAVGSSVYVNPGEHVVAAKSGDREVRARQAVPAGATASVVLEVPPVMLLPNAAPVVATPPGPTAATAKVPEPSRGVRVLPRGVVWVGAGLTAALVAVTIASGVDTQNAKRRYDAAPSGTGLDDGRSKETRTNALFWSTIAVGALTSAAAIWLVEWKADGGAARVGARVGAMSASVAGTFP